MRKPLILFALLLASAVGAARAATDEVAVVGTPFGEIVIRFFPDAAPGHVAYFKELARRGFYDGTTFHRVIPHFVVQGGDPNSKNADRADDGEGEGDRRLKAEFSETLHYRPGTVGMARDTDPDSGSCQFFIALENLPRLDGKYTIFGEVTAGLDVARRIAEVPRDGADNPLRAVPIKVTIEKRAVPAAVASRTAGASGEVLTGPVKPLVLDPAATGWTLPAPAAPAPPGLGAGRIELTLDEAGRVIDARFPTVGAPGAEAARTAALGWSFSPARWDGTARKVRFTCGPDGRDIAAPLSGSAPLAFTHARLMPVEREPIDDGVMIVEGTTVKALGPRASTAIPPGARTIDLAGSTVIPGLVDTHSHVGGPGGGDGSAAQHPDVRVMDSIDPLDPGFRRAAAGGITTLNVMPGSGLLLSGQTIYLKNRRAHTVEELVVRDGKGDPVGGMKMANGTNSMRGAPLPGTRGKSAALDRALFVRAQDYAEKRKASDPAKQPARDLGLDAVAEALAGKRTIHFHTHRADDILTILRMKQEFGFPLVLQHVTEGYKVAAEIARAKVPVSLTLIDSPGGKLETADLTFANAGLLEKAGVTVALNTDDWIIDSRFYIRTAAMAVRGGMSRAGALAALTLNPARMLGLADRIGSLAPGKDADFVVLGGDPLSVYTRVKQTWVEGQKVFDLDDPQDRLYAEGGYGAGRPVKPYLCCAGEDQ